MQIASITSHVYTQPILHRPKVKARLQDLRQIHQTVLVRVETLCGLVGWGEAFGHFGCAPVTKAAIDTVVAPRCIGKHFDVPSDVTTEVQRILHALGAGAIQYAISGVDIALWDLLGKQRGLSVSKLLCQTPCDSLPAYASLMRYRDSTVLSHEIEAAKHRGYKGIKVHEFELEAITAAKLASGPLDYMVDVNCAWSDNVAGSMLDAMAELGVQWVEEPTWPPEDYFKHAFLARAHGISLAVGENALSQANFLQIINTREITYVQPSVTKIGGITSMWDLAVKALRAGLRVAPHSPYFGPGLMATLHICAALNTEIQVEHLFYDLALGPYRRHLEPVNGHFLVPQSPGLGLDPEDLCNF